MASTIKSLPAFLYIAMCWIALCIIPYAHIGPVLFLTLFFVSLALGFALIMLQVDDLPIDAGLAVVMLSGKVVPAVKESYYEIKDEPPVRICVSCGKVVFFFLAIFILVFWFRISFHGLPGGWMEKGYEHLVVMYPFTRLGMDRAEVVEDFNFGEYGKMVLDYHKLLFHVSLIYKPMLVSLPYIGLIYWALRRRREIGENG